MKPAGNSIRWWRIAIWLIAILTVGGLAWSIRTKTSYGSVCVKCLQRMHGLEVKCCGIPISNEQKLERFRPAPEGGGGFILGSMPSVDPKNYADIAGYPCAHSFKRTGFCRYSSRGVGCGHFGEGIAFRPRLEVLEIILRTFSRIPDRDLGKGSLAVLDRIFPPDAMVKEAGKLSYDFTGTVKNLETMVLLLSIVETPDEWRRALDHFENGFQGEAPLIYDESFIESRSHSADPLVRRGCAAVTAKQQTSPSLEHLASMLTDEDEVLSQSAGDKVFQDRQFALFGKLFRRRPPDRDRIEAMTNYSDADFVKLLELDDPVVDEVCFQTIANGQRFTLLDQVVKQLNHRDSDAGRAAASRLIKGPSLGFYDNALRDPWESFHVFDGPLEKAMERVRQGYSRSSYLESLLKSMKALAVTHEPAHWPLVKHAYEQSADDGVDGFYIAFMAKAMMELDPNRTEKYLIDELGRIGRHRSLAALAAMGYLALPEFKDAITGFIAKESIVSTGNSGSTRDSFPDGKPKKTKEYALHRCQGIQNWQLLRDANGTYYIKKL